MTGDASVRGADDAAAGGRGPSAGGPWAGGGGPAAGSGVDVDPRLGGALRRYQVMAFVVGVGLLVLVLIGVPLQYAANQPKVAQIVGPIHGFLYIVYLLAATDLARRARFSLLQMAAMIGAGFLPFLAFVIERRVSRRVRTEALPAWSWPPRRAAPSEPSPGT